MDAEDFMDWFMWGTIFFCFVVVCIIVAAWLLAVTIAEVVSLIRRRRNDGNNKSAYEYDMSIEKLLLRPEDDDNEDCVICLEEYEEEEHGCGGERGRWSVLPGCAHAFHKECVVKWLRNRTSCPLCRSDVVAAAVARRAPTITNNIAAADDMV